ncbi:MAG TPA: hypothetical protein VGJ97_02655 [Anaerolineaceae bacterium]|jgi:hypothetical protein
MTATTASNTDQRTSMRLSAFPLHRGAAFGMILLAALIAFEIFNFSTTDFALGDMLGKLTFAGVRWSTILALAFCGIDFAGIARLFTPEKVAHEASEVWYLFGAWLLAATMNAILTWWGVSIAVQDHAVQSTAVIDPALLVQIVPIFVAVMVWLIRVLIIGTLSYAGERLFLQADQPERIVPMMRSHTIATHTARGVVANPVPTMMARPHTTAPAAAPYSQPVPSLASAPRPAPRPEPTYQRVSGRPSTGSTPQQNGMMAD